MGVQKDENGNMQIKSFIEKPDYTKQPPTPNDFKNPGEYDEAMIAWEKVQTAADPNNSDVFFANPGMYYLDDKAVKVLMAQGIVNPDKTGLGSHVMTKIVELCNEGKLKDENGNTLKAYTVPLEAKGGKPAVWDDIGTAEAYLSLIKDIDVQVIKYGISENNKYYGADPKVLTDFAKNTDLETGIVFHSKEARQALSNFATEKNITEIKGNIYVR